MTVMMTKSNMLTLKKMLLTSTPFGWDQGCGSQILEGGSGSGKSKVDPDPASGRIQLSTFPGKNWISRYFNEVIITCVSLVQSWRSLSGSWSHFFILIFWWWSPVYDASDFVSQRHLTRWLRLGESSHIAIIMPTVWFYCDLFTQNLCMIFGLSLKRKIYHMTLVLPCKDTSLYSGTTCTKK